MVKKSNHTFELFDDTGFEIKDIKDVDTLAADIACEVIEDSRVGDFDLPPGGITIKVYPRRRSFWGTAATIVMTAILTVILGLLVAFLHDRFSPHYQDYHAQICEDAYPAFVELCDWSDRVFFPLDEEKEEERRNTESPATLPEGQFHI